MFGSYVLVGQPLVSMT